MSFENTLTRLSSSESVASPLRKKSILAQANTQATPEALFNDDDAERRERRRKSVAPDPGAGNNTNPDAANRRKSLGLGACSGLSSAQLAEHYASCIKLSTENKITVKNAFSLQLIDYMSMMLKRQDKQMEDFQVASCTLDASTKIYSFRVDAVHSDVIQMASTMGRSEANRKKKKSADDGDAAEDAGDVDNDGGDDGDGPPESEVMKKLKKKTRKHKNFIEKPEALSRKRQDFVCVEPFHARLSADLKTSQSGDCPFHHAIKYMYNTDDEKSKVSKGHVPLPVPTIPDISDLEICPSFRDFTMVGWKPENDPAPVPDKPPPPPAPFNLDDDHAFDMNQTPEPIPDIDYAADGVYDAGMDSDQEEIYAGPEAASRAAAKLARPAHVVDLKEHLSTVPLEYSYFQQSMVSMWAGPTHWKVKPMRKDKEKDIAVHKEAKKRSKKEIVLNFEDTAEIAQKYFAGGSRKLNKKTIQGWNPARLTIPRNIHYDANRITRLFCRERISVKVNGDTPAADVDEGVGEYKYDNPVDQASFCPNVPVEEDDDDHGADMGDGMMHDDEDMFQSADGNNEMLTQEQEEQEIGAFTGDNLIAAPNKVAKLYIPYQMRAKKMDMKKLKGSMWAVMTKSTEENLDDAEALKADNRRVEGSILFSELYEELPRRLPQKLKENLSCPLAFVGLLHLANEKCLEIRNVEGSNDLTISQD